MGNKIKNVTRYIKRNVERELWARSAGRCEFAGCNKPLYKSPITQERVNISEKAHIYSFSQNGPRGWGPFIINRNELNDISNLMLMCHDCHETIDQDKEGIRYTPELLINWKNEHEQKVMIVTGISPHKKSHVVLYGANIGQEKSPLCHIEAVEAMFPDKFPAEEKSIDLSMRCEHEDNSRDFWETEKTNLKTLFQRQIEFRIRENNPSHFSLFALAPQPLLIQLGTLFTDKIDVDVYQLHREPKNWRWQSHPERFRFIINEPPDYEHNPALIISLSDRIAPERVKRVIGNNVSIWELTVEEEFLHNDFLRSQAQLSLFRECIRKLMVSIKKKHGNLTPLHIFPAMPVSCAVEFGRVRMPKADMPWIIFDQNNKEEKFINAISI